jgi:hypothetical protein
MPDKNVTVMKLALRGSLSLAAMAALHLVLDQARDLFAAVQIWDRHSDLVALPDQLDLQDLGLAGFARAAFQELQEKAVDGSPDAVVARDALALLYRLAKRVQP